jgi:hypothetical protein
MYVGLKCMKRDANMTIGKRVSIKSLMNKRSTQWLVSKKNNRAAGGCIGVVMRICQYIC